MKKILIVFITLALVAMAGVATAADTTNLTVSAAVLGTCKFATAASSLNFGNLDPAVGTDANASDNLTQFWCTKGVAADVISADNGSNWSGTSRQMKDVASPDMIPYSLVLTPDANPNTGPASPRTLTISGTVLGADYITKSAGNYVDTVVLTINP